MHNDPFVRLMIVAAAEQGCSAAGKDIRLIPPQINIAYPQEIPVMSSTCSTV